LSYLKLINFKQIIGAKKSPRKTKGFNNINKYEVIKTSLNYDGYSLLFR
jgi:hypothetical protein